MFLSMILSVYSFPVPAVAEWWNLFWWSEIFPFPPQTGLLVLVQLL